MSESTKVSEYKRLLDDVIELSFDMEGVGFLPEEQEDDILKCKYIIAIYESLSDVPLRKAKWFLQKNKIEFNLVDEYEDLLEW